MEIQQDDLKKNANNHDYLLLNEYYYVVIDSLRSNFFMILGGLRYEFEKGIKFLPVFPLYHDIQIEITPEIKIYIEPNIYNRVKVQKIHYDYNYYPSNELLSILNNFPYMYCNMNIVSSDYINYFIAVENGIINPVLKKYKKNINEEKFYLDIELNNLNNLIHLYDKYIQYEFIKIYKF